MIAAPVTFESTVHVMAGRALIGPISQSTAPHLTSDNVLGDV